MAQRNVLRGTARRLMRLLVPGRCVGCGLPGTDCCSSCGTALRYAPVIRGAAFPDAGPPARMVRTAKRGAARAIAGDLVDAAVARGAFAGMVAIDFVTWVPHDPRRGPRRGAHLPRLVATRLGTVLDIPALPLLVRAHAPAQRGRSRGDRLAALDGIFHVHAKGITIAVAVAAVCSRARARDDTAGAITVLLVDDVRTTGATLDAAALPLRDLGMVVHPWALLAVERRSEQKCCG